MNKGRRTSLREATGLLDRAVDIIKDARNEEQECLDNMPENLQGSERYESMESAIDSLEEAIEKIDDAKESIGEAMG